VRGLSCMAEVRFLFGSLLMCVGVCALFLKSGGIVPCLIYIFMHITPMDLGLQNHAWLGITDGAPLRHAGIPEIPE
jgi:hypothetical protein